MAQLTEETRPVLPVADPAPLGLAAFALTTFVLSVHNAGWAPELIFVGLALFYGGLAQFAAGMWEFKNRNTFGATAFSSYGGFWMSLAFFVVLVLAGKVAAADVTPSLGWFVLAFAIFNTYMMVWSARVNWAVFAVFLTLEITEILLFLGYLGGTKALVTLGGYMGIITALVAWYASAAGVVNSMAPTPFLPVGKPLWGALPTPARAELPQARTQP
ncbi:MAG: acetate uptake transporter [Candidatus Dormibacteraeota bacterium]|uniref:Acetate uptake transporter n=1 Tax=Candidatus Dormiibacter inghamiae TaxID=3127013 RepID=A0A934NC97_9BACT|nr:acetate uptake transporter [Candidatus Dormibacteraeota bacterium]MBJ7605934.1 acetate uptake transporter [Candidatus Dormibacteraeota bacterium]